MHLWKISYVSIAAAPDEILDTTVLEICALAEQHNARAGQPGGWMAKPANLGTGGRIRTDMYCYGGF